MMKKKIIVELCVIGVTTMALVFASASLIPQKKKPLVAGTDTGGAAKGPVSRLTKLPNFLSPVIKIKTMKDDNFYVKFCRITDALPFERDPFDFSWTGPRSKRDSLDLTGILWNEKEATAVINGVFYTVGDSSEQFKVTGIQEDKVLLKDGVGDFELRLKR